MLRRKHNFLSTIGVALVCLGMIVVLATCGDDGGGGNGGGSTAKYTCANGTPAEGTPDGDADVAKCASCEAGYKLDGDACVAVKYTCANGTPSTDTLTTGNADVEKCTACNSGYKQSGDTCVVEAVYTCENGTPATGSPDGDANVAKCASCEAGYKLDGDACVAVKYTCANGTASTDALTTGNEDVEKCTECDTGFMQMGDTCVSEMYTCTNGMAAAGSPGLNEGSEKCTDCNAGYRLDMDNELCELNRYICTNGTAVKSTDSDKPDTDEMVEKCDLCDAGYHQEGDGCALNQFICTDGTPVESDASNRPDDHLSVQNCMSCNDSSAPVNGRCSTAVYTCDNGTPASGKPAGETDVEQCMECSAGYRLDGVTCELNRYICTNGVAAVATEMDKPATDETVELCAACDTGYRLDNGLCALNRYICTGGIAAEPTDSDKPDTDMTDEKCSACNFGYGENGEPQNDKCSLSTVGRWKFDTDPGCNSPSENTCVVDMDADGNVMWLGSCGDYAPLNNYSNYTLDENSITFSGGGLQHDFVIDAGASYLRLNPHSSTLSGNRYMCQYFGAIVTQPALVGAVSNVGGTFTTDSDSGTLYWAVYADGATVADADTLINGVKAGTAGVQRSATTGVTVTNTPATTTFMVSGLNQSTAYDLYVALEATVDGIEQTVLSGKYDFTTAEITCGMGQHAEGNSCVNNSYICPNGEAVVSTDTDRPDTHNTVEACLSCTAPYHLSSARECSFMVVEHVDGSNNVVGRTITCDEADVGESATIDLDGDGTKYVSATYTKRTTESDNIELPSDSQLPSDSPLLITTTNAATSCTSDITNMNSLFLNQDSFIADITHWDTSSVTDMAAMFNDGAAPFSSEFNQDIGYWDVSNVTNMSDMFNSAEKFNQNLGNWDVSSVRNFNSMFAFAVKFNNGGSDSIGSWDIVGPTDRNHLEAMFWTASEFGQDISEWCVSGIIEPDSFSTDALATWADPMNGLQPQWNTSAGNNCPVNFTNQPTFVSADSTVTLTASKDSSLHWILLDTDQMYGNVGDLTSAIGNGDGVARSVDGTTAADDAGETIQLSGLTSGATYYFYAALVSGDESELSDRVEITAP